MKSLSLEQMELTIGGKYSWGCGLSIALAVGATLAFATNPVGWGLALTVGLKVGSYFSMADAC